MSNMKLSVPALNTRYFGQVSLGALLRVQKSSANTSWSLLVELVKSVCEDLLVSRSWETVSNSVI